MPLIGVIVFSTSRSLDTLSKTGAFEKLDFGDTLLPPQRREFVRCNIDDQRQSRCIPRLCCGAVNR